VVVCVVGGVAAVEDEPRGLEDGGSAELSKA